MGGREWSRSRPFLGLRSMDSEPSWGLWRSPPRGVAGERVTGMMGPEKAIVKQRNFRPCSLVVLFSETALEEPFTAAEGVYMGLDSASRAGRHRGREAAVTYTGIFVH